MAGINNDAGRIRSQSDFDNTSQSFITSTTLANGEKLIAILGELTKLAKDSTSQSQINAALMNQQTSALMEAAHWGSMTLDQRKSEAEALEKNNKAKLDELKTQREVLALSGASTEEIDKKIALQQQVNDKVSKRASMERQIALEVEKADLQIAGKRRRQWAEKRLEHKKELSDILESSKVRQQEAEKQYAKSLESGNESDIAEALKNLQDANILLGKAQSDVDNSTTFFATDSSKMKSFKQQLGDAVAAGISKGLNELKKAFTDAESNMTQYQASIDARLQGTGKTYENMSKLVTKNLAMSPFVKQTDMLSNINNAVVKGVGYNVELRAFLESIKDDISTTFDAFDSNLMRVIRIQGEDSTAARMGMEASLTKLFNTYFSDTSYLSDAFDQVTGALVDTNSLLSKEEGVGVEYTLQKWLGSLYSLGFSQSAVTSIADAVNMLGTGDVEGLTGNSSMQSLLAMAASRSNQDYAEILTEGLNSSKLNDLMYSMVEYLAEIADSTTENNVVRSAYGNVFGLSVTDIQAARSLMQNGTASELLGTQLDYSGAMSELGSQLASLPKRLNTATYISNLLSNMAYSAGANIVNNTGSYLLYKATDLVEGLTGGIQIPTISVMGNSIGDLGTVTGLIKSGMLGISLLSTLIGGLGTLGGGSLSDLSSWGGSEVRTRGSGFELTSTSGRSGTISIGNASSEDIEYETIDEAENSAEKRRKKKKGKTSEEEIDFEDLYNGLFDTTDATAVLSNESKAIQTIAPRIIEMSDTIANVYNDKMLNVNLQGINGQPVSNGVPTYFSGGLGSASGYTQMEQFIRLFAASLGLRTTGMDSDMSDEYTLQDLINFFIDDVGSAADGSGMNVNLSGNEVDAMSFLGGRRDKAIS